MNAKRLFLVGMVGVLSVALGVNAAVVTDHGVSYWKFDETSGTNADDAWNTNENDGTTETGATWTTTTAGLNSSGAISLDGTTAGQVNVSDHSSLDITGAISVEAWVNVNTHVAWAGIVNKGPAATPAYVLMMYSDGRPYFQVKDSANTTRNCYSTSIPVLALDTWYHLVGVFDGEDISIYINKSEYKKDFTGAFTIRTNDDALVIGAIGTSEFNGIVDDVKIYDKALLSAEVTQNYNAIPEPATITLLLLGLPFTLRRRKR